MNSLSARSSTRPSTDRMASCSALWEYAVDHDKAVVEELVCSLCERGPLVHAAATTRLPAGAAHLA